MENNIEIKKVTLSHQERVALLRQRIKLIHRAKMSRRIPMPVTSTLNRFAHGHEVDGINLDKIEAYIEALGDYTTGFDDAYMAALTKRGLNQ